MNTVLSYLMAFALQIIALMLPHNGQKTSITCPYQYEEGLDVTPNLHLIPNEEILSDNC